MRQTNKRLHTTLCTIWILKDETDGDDKTSWHFHFSGKTSCFFTPYKIYKTLKKNAPIQLSQLVFQFCPEFKTKSLHSKAFIEMSGRHLTLCIRLFFEAPCKIRYISKRTCKIDVWRPGHFSPPAHFKVKIGSNYANGPSK